MLKKYIIALFMLLSSGTYTVAQQVDVQDRNWLSKAYQNLYATTNAFPNLIKWQSLQKSETLAIAALPDDSKTQFIARANEAIKYLPQIVNGLWLILEEGTWVAPAHIVV